MRTQTAEAHKEYVLQNPFSTAGVEAQVLMQIVIKTP